MDCGNLECEEGAVMEGVARAAAALGVVARAAAALEAVATVADTLG